VETDFEMRSDRTTGNRHKSEHGEFQLIIWKNISLWGQRNPGTAVQRGWGISTPRDLSNSVRP